MAKNMRSFAWHSARQKLGGIVSNPTPRGLPPCRILQTLKPFLFPCSQHRSLALCTRFNLAFKTQQLWYVYFVPAHAPTIQTLAAHLYYIVAPALAVQTSVAQAPAVQTPMAQAPAVQTPVA